MCTHLNFFPLWFCPYFYARLFVIHLICIPFYSLTVLLLIFFSPLSFHIYGLATLSGPSVLELPLSLQLCIFPQFFCLVPVLTVALFSHFYFLAFFSSADKTTKITVKTSFSSSVFLYFSSVLILNTFPFLSHRSHPFLFTDVLILIPSFSVSVFIFPLTVLCLLLSCHAIAVQ